MGRVIQFIPTGTKIGNTIAGTPWYSDAYETIDLKQILLQLVVDNAMGPVGAACDVHWEISNDLKNWVLYPSGALPFGTVFKIAGATTSNQTIIETNIGAYMRVVVVISEPGAGADCAFQLSVTGSGRN